MFFARLIWRHFLAGSLSQNVVSTLVRRGCHPLSPQLLACRTKAALPSKSSPRIISFIWPCVLFRSCFGGWMFGLFRKKVVAQYRVNIQPADLELQLKQGENLLEAVLERGIAAPFNCRVGACKTCQIKVLEGRPRSLIEREYVFSQEEIGAGAFLACQTRVESDLNSVW